MKQAKYYVCPVCGAITMTTGQSGVSCCGRSLEALVPQKAAEADKLTVERVEDEWYITSGHPMTKEHFVSFMAYVTSDTVTVTKLYPEQDAQTRFPMRGSGTILVHCNRHGLFRARTPRIRRAAPGTLPRG